MGVSYSSIVAGVHAARGEVGYREGRNRDGTWNNIQKYSPAVPGLEWSQAQPWCATFLSWVEMVSGTAALFPRTASVPAAHTWFKDNGYLSEYPAIGAWVGFGHDQHIGKVVWFDAHNVYTVEGNTNDNGSPEGDGVYLKQHLRTDPWVSWYGYPSPTKVILPSADPAYNAAHGPKTGVPACDFSSPNIDPAALQRAGIKAAGQYLSDFPSKNITLARAKALAEHGVSSFLFWENTKGEASQGYDVGVKAARKALAQADALGIPKNVPVHFAVDSGIYSWTDVKPFFDGARSVLGARTGTYGSFFITTAARADGILFTVQTQGWSSGLLDPHANAIQWARTPMVADTDDESIINAMPMFTPGVSGPAAPTVKPKTEVHVNQALRELAMVDPTDTKENLAYVAVAQTALKKIK